ncbi:MAG: hypothetical protein GJT30_14945 [Geobacter sp.]|nr:hypothetical protein [Geobacter sp.]
MTKRMMIVIALGLAVLTGTAVYAGWGCNGGGMFGLNANLEKVRTFQKETGTLRDDMMIKRLELSQEQAKAMPDQSRVTVLRQEIIDIRTKLQQTALKLGLTDGCLAQCDQDPLDCPQAGCGRQGRQGQGQGQGRMAVGCANCPVK